MQSNGFLYVIESFSACLSLRNTSSQTWNLGYDIPILSAIKYNFSNRKLTYSQINYTMTLIIQIN